MRDDDAMSGDRGDGPVRRPRPIKRAQVGPGPLRELKDLLYEVYLAAGAPTLDEIAADIADAAAEDAGIPGTPSRDTVHRCISSSEIPVQQADAISVATVLARRAAWDEQSLITMVGALWLQSRMATRAGRPISDITDPFDLEVHRAIDVAMPGGGELPLLPAYIGRELDGRRRHLVRDA